MIYIIIISILLFDFIVLTMSSKCSRIEEKLYIQDELNKK